MPDWLQLFTEDLVGDSHASESAEGDPTREKVPEVLLPSVPDVTIDLRRFAVMVWFLPKVWRSYPTGSKGPGRGQRFEFATSVRRGGTRLLFLLYPKVSLSPSERLGRIYAYSSLNFIRACEE